MAKQWTHRDRDAEKRLIVAAMDQVIERHVAGGSKPPPIKELADTAGIRRDYLYEHKELLDEYRNRVAAVENKSVAVIDLEAEVDALKAAKAKLQAQAKVDAEEIRHLRLLLAETTLALDTEMHRHDPPTGPPHLESI